MLLWDTGGTQQVSLHKPVAVLAAVNCLMQMCMADLVKALANDASAMRQTWCCAADAAPAPT
jgi:hypothetical protein